MLKCYDKNSPTLCMHIFDYADHMDAHNFEIREHFCLTFPYKITYVIVVDYFICIFLISLVFLLVPYARVRSF